MAIAGLLTAIRGMPPHNPSTPPSSSPTPVLAQRTELIDCQQQLEEAVSEGERHRLSTLVALQHVWRLERHIALTGGHPPERPAALRW